MNPSNTQQHPPSTAQYYITGMPPLSSATSILKSNASVAASTVTQQQPSIVSALNNVGSSAKNPVIGNNLSDSTKYVTTASNYMPVLLNQTLISSIDPIKYQQKQHPPKIAPSNISTSNTNLPLTSGNASKPVVLSAANTAASNITYQVLSTSQNNISPVIAAPNSTVSVLLASSQPMATAGHVAAPIIIRNTPTTTTTNKSVQIKQQTQLPVAIQQQPKQQQQEKLTLNQQPLNAEVLKQIVVGNPCTGAKSVVAPGKTLLKSTILQNKQVIQHQEQQQQIQNKAVVKNTKMMITPQQLLQKHNNNHTIITTTSDNSPQMHGLSDMELKTSNVAQTVKKFPQVSLLQNSTKKSSNNIEVITEAVTVLKNPNEIKVGNLNSEVSFIKKPSASSKEIKSKESSLLKSTDKIQTEIVDNNCKQDVDKCSIITKKPNNNNRETTMGKEISEKCSLLKTSQDSTFVVPEGVNINNKSCSAQAEKQTSLLKTQVCNKKPSEEFMEASKAPDQLISPRSQRSNSYNTVQKPNDISSTTNNERRYSEPSKADLVTSVKITKNNSEDNEYREDTESIKSQELEIFFEDEEYLESSGDKSPTSSEKSHNDNGNKSSQQPNDELEETTNNDAKEFKTTKLFNLQEKELDSKEKMEIAEKENMEVITENKSPAQDHNNVGNSSDDDDDVTILPAEEVEIEPIEIDDDDEDEEKDISQTDLRSTSEDKERPNNESLLCDEQFLVSSSSSLSNNSLDQSSVTSSLMKSPLIDNTITPLLKKTLMEPKGFNQKEEPQSNGYSSVLDMLSNFNMLNWRERIGTARGTNLKFQLNEFNLIQLYEKNMSNKRIHTAYEKPIYERESSQKRNENSEPPTYYMCRRCNVQGPAVDFLAPEFCSLSCLKRDCRKRRDDSASLIRKRNRLNNVNNFANKILNNYVNETSSNINNPPPLAYIKKPKFRWTTYMNRNYNVIAAPISLFLNPFPTGPNNFLVGMKLEAIDPENCALFCVCTVISIMGYRLKLSFDGYSSAYDFWLNADSMDIFPPGWCTKTNRILQPPKGIAANKFNWGAYLSKEKALPAPRHLFTHLNSSSLAPTNPFKVGMHLEAEDLNDTGKLCVASVADVLDDRIRIHFDGWDDCYDIIVDINSPYIHPCGWHVGRQQLVVPPDCENTAFNWNDYIRKQGTGEAACEELFSPREPIGFKPNMRLEVVDPRNPSLIRPATVISHKGHRVKLHLDGWPSDYCFWLEDDSPDLHPIGWCDATGHDLEPPPGFQISKQKMPCPVEGCRGIGNARNVFKCFHASREGCPYAAENWRTVVEKPQRVNYENIVRTLPKQGKNPLVQQGASIQSRLSEQQILERLQMLDNIKTRNVLLQQEKLPTTHSDLLSSFPLRPPKNEEKEIKLSKTVNSASTTSLSSSCAQQQECDNSAVDINIDIAKEFLYDYGPRLQQNFHLWQTNFSFDADKIKRNPLKWSTTEVSVFVDLYLNCRQTATLFNHEDIDGQAFLLLQQHDLTEKLGLKLGPAVKLYTCILQLRTLAVTKFKVPYRRLLIKK